jgi:exodeoxyribonuclease X
MSLRWIAGDVESSGLGKDAGVVEIAWVELNEQLDIIDEWHSLIDPEVPIEPGASGVHGIVDADVADAPTLSQFFSLVHPGKIAGDVVLIAHNAPFDRRFFAPWCEQLVGTIDTLRLARRFFPEAQNHKLQTLRYTFGLDAGEAHSAKGDVRTLHHLLRILVDKSGMPLADLYQDSYRPLFVTSMPFGKHKGKSMQDLPVDYLKWMAGLGDLDPDLKFTVNKILKDAA